MASISVVIPTYNCVRYLPDAVESVWQQSVAIQELIIVDDGSTDGTADYVSTLGLGTKVLYLRQPNAGPAAARNRGIAAATGDLVAFLDADDTWLPTTLERLAHPFEQYPEVALVTADKSIMDSDGRVIVESWYQRNGLLDRFRGLCGRPIPNAVALLTRTNFVNTSVVLVRRSVLQEVGAFDAAIRFGEDLELWARIASRYPIVALPERLGLYRQHGANVTRNTEAMLKDLVLVAVRIRGWSLGRLDTQGIDPDRLVAEAWSNLGYWYFSHGEHAKSRTAFWRSIRARVSPRAAGYLAATLAPASLISCLRRMKGALSSPRT